MEAVGGGEGGRFVCVVVVYLDGVHTLLLCWRSFVDVVLRFSESDLHSVIVFRLCFYVFLSPGVIFV